MRKVGMLQQLAEEPPKEEEPKIEKTTPKPVPPPPPPPPNYSHQILSPVGARTDPRFTEDDDDPVIRHLVKQIGHHIKTRNEEHLKTALINTNSKDFLKKKLREDQIQMAMKYIDML